MKVFGVSQEIQAAHNEIPKILAADVSCPCTPIQTQKVMCCLAFSLGIQHLFIILNSIKEPC